MVSSLQASTRTGMSGTLTGVGAWRAAGPALAAAEHAMEQAASRGRPGEGLRSARACARPIRQRGTAGPLEAGVVVEASAGQRVATEGVERSDLWPQSNPEGRVASKSPISTMSRPPCAARGGDDREGDAGSTWRRRWHDTISCGTRVAQQGRGRGRGKLRGARRHAIGPGRWRWGERWQVPCPCHPHLHRRRRRRQRRLHRRCTPCCGPRRRPCPRCRHASAQRATPGALPATRIRLLGRNSQGGPTSTGRGSRARPRLSEITSRTRLSVV